MANIVPLQRLWQDGKENATKSAATKITVPCPHEKENTIEVPNTHQQGQKDEKKQWMDAAANMRSTKEVQQQQDTKETTTREAVVVAMLPHGQKDEEKDDDDDDASSMFHSSMHVNVPSVLAKCASGVPFLMSSVDERAVLSKRLDSPQQLLPTRIVLSPWELCRHLFFGNFASEDSGTQSPFSERVS
jgi:hypothetical protein